MRWQRGGRGRSARVATSLPPASTGQHVPGPMNVFEKIGFGAGAIAFGVKETGFSFFLLLFYNQVLGLPASWVGAALMTALLVDAVIDPSIGSLSDRWRSRWGRRHPFMYAAALPAALTYFLLWNPPAQLHGAGLAAYLLVMTVLVRGFIALYEVPSTALVPELTRNYDERTSLFAYRSLMGWASGIVVAVLAYAVYLRPTAAQPFGVLNRDGYSGFALTGSGLIFASIVISALVTHRRIVATQSDTVIVQDRSIGRRLRQLLDTVSYRPILMLFMAGMASGLSFGLASALNVYMFTYLWGLDNAQMSMLTMGSFCGAILAFAVAPRLSRRLEKRNAAVVSGLLYVIASAAPVLLHLEGLFPDVSSPVGFLVLTGTFLLSTLALSSMTMLVSSMLADTTEETELRTGHRQEGIVFSLNLLVQKSMSGAGVFGAGLVLSLIRFPEQGSANNVTPDIVNSLGAVFAAVQILSFGLAVGFLTQLKLSRARHQANLEALQEK